MNKKLLTDNLFTRAFHTFRGYSRRKQAAIAGGAIAALLIVIPVLTYAYFVRDITDRERLMNRNNTGVVLLDKNGEVFYSYGRINQQNDIKLADISDHLEKAAVASEDKDFYKHEGYSLRGMAAAIYGNLLNRDATRYGGSTITQQLVKNNLLHSSKSFLRKYQELSIAIAIERYYTKDEILEMYLNSVYFGEGAFGIGAASKAYFNKAPKDLTLAESSLLVGILPAPSAYSPISGDPEKAELHQDRVLKRMVDTGYITEAQNKAADEQKLTFESAPAAANNHAQHFALMVIDELNNRYGEERVTRSGFAVTTTLDLNWQRLAEEQVRARVDQISRLGGRNGSLVAMDPKSGEIRALVGSANWEDPKTGKVNMATSPRQPGSSFKPIYYTEALDERLITPASILHDAPKTYGSWRPQNYDFRFRGDITTRRALALSLNLPAIEVMEKLGVEEAVDKAQEMGISTVNDPQRYGLSLALGTAETKLLDMTHAYSAFANGGNQYPVSTISSIKDKFDKNIFTNRPKAKRVQSSASSFLISSILSDNEARAATFGGALTIPGRSVAVKTGTTDDYKDGWTIGYTPSLVVGTWVGNNESEPMQGVAGSSGPAPMWRAAIRGMLGNSRAEQFTQPAEVEKLRVCSSNGLRAEQGGNGTYDEFFIDGTAPTQSCNQPKPEDDKDRKKEEEKEDEPEDDENSGPGGGNGNGNGNKTQCSDEKDNDGDGLIDVSDPGCTATEDDNEEDPEDDPVDPPPPPPQD